MITHNNKYYFSFKIYIFSLHTLSLSISLSAQRILEVALLATGPLVVLFFYLCIYVLCLLYKDRLKIAIYIYVCSYIVTLLYLGIFLCKIYLLGDCIPKDLCIHTCLLYHKIISKYRYFVDTLHMRNRL